MQPPKMLTLARLESVFRFLIAAHDYWARHHAFDRAQKKKLKSRTFFGIEVVDSVTRLCAMNVLLHGIGGESEEDLPVVTKDALAWKRVEYEIVLAKPPFNDSDWFRKDDDVRWHFGVPFSVNSNN